MLYYKDTTGRAAGMTQWSRFTVLAEITPGGSQPSLTPAPGEKSTSLSSVHTCTNMHIPTFRPTLMHIIRNKIKFKKL